MLNAIFGCRWDDYCGIENRPAWCKDESAFTIIDNAGKVPSSAVLTAPGTVNAAVLNLIKVYPLNIHIIVKTHSIYMC